VAQFQSYRTKSLNTTAQSDLRNAMASEEAYYAEHSKYFSLTLSGGSAGNRNMTLNVAASENVNLGLTSITDDYTGTSRHTADTKTYTVTGSVGVIR
jgi:Tfp pilus assembly protein PilE